MKLRLRYDLGEGPIEVQTNLYVVVAWERKYKRKASDIGSAGIGAEDLAFMAHQTAMQHGITVPAVLDDFIKKCVSLEVVSDPDPHPTEAASTDTL